MARAYVFCTRIRSQRRYGLLSILPPGATWTHLCSSVYSSLTLSCARAFDPEIYVTARRSYNHNTRGGLNRNKIIRSRRQRFSSVREKFHYNGLLTTCRTKPRRIRLNVFINPLPITNYCRRFLYFQFNSVHK